MKSKILMVIGLGIVLGSVWGSAFIFGTYLSPLHWANIPLDVTATFGIVAGVSTFIYGLMS